MDNQHREIKGYRELSEHEIAVMNLVKGHGEALGELVEKLRAMPETDKRWVSIGATDLQTGLMALTRSIAKPTFFALCLLTLSGCVDASLTRERGVTKDGYTSYKTVLHVDMIDEPVCAGSCKP